ncbi:MAG: phosphoribosylglycinamide formyltransferase, partial [Ignavibacteria bacterium]|nr:phosphoribosylglycinamide formyltransferase [Ignavibacteria bacterium]
MNICVFASGAGSNFKAILDSIKKGVLRSRVCLLITNNPDCGAVKIAEKYKINHLTLNKKLFPELSEKEYSDKFLYALKKYEIDFIVLAGYMKMIRPEVLRKYKNKIINIHPALLPSFGGKGMYGINVHKAVIASGVK